MRIKTHSYPLISIFILVSLFFILSCERQDLFSYAEKEVTDIISPVPGNYGIITPSNITAQGLTLTWTEASDDRSSQPDLEYSAYVSNSNNIDTIENIESNGTSVGVWAAGITSIPVTGLTDFTNYFFNVITRDEAGNLAAYRTCYARTADVTPPVVTITDPPSDNSHLCRNYPVTVSATAADNSGVVQKVEFYIGNILLGEDTEASGTVYDCSFTSPDDSATLYQITAVAYDEQGNTAEYSVYAMFDISCP